MPQYMLLIYGDPTEAPSNESPEWQAEHVELDGLHPGDARRRRVPRR